MEKVRLDAAFDSFEERWSPRLAAEVDDHAVKLAKLEGEFVWHSHADADELFLVRSGELTIELREDSEAATSVAGEASDERAGREATRERSDVHLEPGDLVVVPAGVEHRPVAEDVAEVLLFERTGTRNTGDVEDERTTDVKRVDRSDP